MSYSSYKGLENGKQLYLDESPNEDEEILIPYHIVDRFSTEDEDGNAVECLCLLRDTVLEEELSFADNITDEYPTYEDSVIDEFFKFPNGEFFNRFKKSVKDQFFAHSIKIANLKTHDYSEIDRAGYLPSSFELFGTTLLRDMVDGDLIFDVSSYDRGIGVPYWTRTPSAKKWAIMSNESGVESNRVITKTCGLRPVVCISRKFFEGDYVEDDNDGRGVSFDLMYSIDIVDSKNVKDTDIDTSKYDDEYLNNSIQRPVEYAVSRFTPKELRGFARINRNIIYDRHILTVDYEQCTDGMFYSYYIDNREALIYGISVDSDRCICKYVYRYLDSDVAVSLNESSLTNYTPEQLTDFYDKGMQLKYFNDNLQLLKYNKPNQNTRSVTGSSVDFLEFSSQDSKIYKVNINSNKQVTREVYKNLISSYEICDTNNSKYESRYDTEFLFNVSNDDYSQVTYNGNVLYVDKLSTTLNQFNGYYFDEFDTAIYKITVAQSGGYYKISRNLHKRIIKTVEINGSTAGITSYTIKGIIDRSDYHISNVQDLYIEYPSGHFDVWITVTAGDSACKVHFPNGTIFVKNQEFGYVGSTDTTRHIDSGKTREISIKDGVVVSMPHGEEWMEFDD